MKADFDRNIKILNLILLIFIATLFGILFLSGCNNGLINVEENSNFGKSSQYATDTTKKISETTEEKNDKEITGNTASTIKEAPEKNNSENEPNSYNSTDVPVMKYSFLLVSVVITGLQMIISPNQKFFLNYWNL